MLLKQLLHDVLQYKAEGQSSYRTTEREFEPATAHLFRAARRAGVDGAYVFQTSPNRNGTTLPPRPAVYVAEASDEEQARKIHRSLWNLGYAPFLICFCQSKTSPLDHRKRTHLGH